MAAAGSLLYDFVSQNAVVLIVGVIATVIAIAVSTYYVARIYLPSNSLEAAAASSVSRAESTRAAPSKDAVMGQSITGADLDEDGVELEESGGDTEQLSIDPVYYCQHIQGEIKKVRQDVTARKICESLSAEQIAEERERQRAQLAEIFKLMQDQQDKFGIGSMDEIQEQMSLYADIK